MASRIVGIFDLAIMETLNGGDLLLVGNDLAKVYGNENQHYLAMFGGNVEQDTTETVLGEERKDYWANRLLWGNSPDLQMNSRTERTLNNIALTSSGRLTLEAAVKDDLKFLSSVAEVTVAVSFHGLNTVRIAIKAIYNTGEKVVTVYTYKKNSDGDFSLYDFNSDFF